MNKELTNEDIRILELIHRYYREKYGTGYRPEQINFAFSFLEKISELSGTFICSKCKEKQAIYIIK